MDEITICIDNTREGMTQTVAFFEKELQKLRAGKASPQMLEGIKVEYYGNLTPIEQVGNISTPDARQIIVQPWERSMLQPIEKAIINANIDVTPQNNGEFIRLVVPTLTEEKRKDMVKKAKQEAEQAKIGVRNIRRSSNETAKKLQDGGLPEDTIKKLEIDIQKLTDDFISKIDKITEIKEKEIMTI
ncbi:MAG: ribosome recycling factor [Bacteroidales bacterium]|jgi:ribosome recycling factor|nr:ribosome recycling factor [Bacteroidales bacterium]